MLKNGFSFWQTADANYLTDLVEVCFGAGRIRVVGGVDEVVPRAERDDRLLQLTQELLDAAGDRVDLVLRKPGAGKTLIGLKL